MIDATNDVQGAGKLHALDELADDAHPVRAFNTLGWENFANPVFDGVTADLFYAAEEGHAKDVADRLIADIGLEPVWLGGIDAFDARRLADTALVPPRIPAQARPEAGVQAAPRRVIALQGLALSADKV